MAWGFPLGLMNRIRELRVSRGETQKSAADTLGVAVTTWENWEAGRSSPSLETAFLLSSSYGVSLDWLVSGSSFKGSAIGSSVEFRNVPRVVGAVDWAYSCVLLFAVSRPGAKVASACLFRCPDLKLEVSVSRSSGGFLAVFS